MCSFVGSCIVCVICGDVGVSGWIQDGFVGIVGDLFSVVRAAATDLDGIAVEDFSKLVVGQGICIRCWS